MSARMGGIETALGAVGYVAYLVGNVIRTRR